MKHNKLKNLISKKKGFTIIELIISIFVLSIAVVGIYNALTVITILTTDSADRLTGTYLAQEGMEIVRNIRDTNWLNMDAASTIHTTYSWDNGLAENALPSSRGCTSLIPCKADYRSESLENGAGYLQISSSGFYVYDSNPSLDTTKFKRRIIVVPTTDVDNISSPYHILKVKVQVSWDKKSTTLNPFISADHCCPDSSDISCTVGSSNCVTTQGTLYNWYNTNILASGVQITSDAALTTVISEADVTMLSSLQTFPLYAKVLPSNATNQGVTWSTTDGTCLSVTTNGLVTAVGSGCTAYITATTVDGLWPWTIYFDVN
jgi:prepilin-type N-terminal cleavage/methylation domain-containing protein